MLTDQLNDYGMVGPSSGCGRDGEKCSARSSLKSTGPRRCSRPTTSRTTSPNVLTKSQFSCENRVEFGGDASFLAGLQLEQHVLLADGKWKIERSVRDTRSRDDRPHIGCGHARAFELGDRRAEYPLPRL